MYSAISRAFGLALDLFYRRRAMGLDIPREGPLIIVANHPNGLIDPLVITRITERDVRFLAKEPLFRMPVIGALLRAMKALPVYRARDGHSTEKNAETFSAVFEALRQGDAICIFPEGTSHSDPRLKPLKTGAARMALGGDPRSRIVPVGLIYQDKATFRSEAVSWVGSPIALGPDLLEQHEEDARAAVAELTEQIGRGLEEVTINLETWDDYELLEVLETIWPNPEEDRLQRMSALARGERDLREQVGSERVDGMRRRISAFRSRLAKNGLRPDGLEGRVGAGTVVRFLLRNLLAVTVGVPVALAGALAYFLPYQTVRLIAARVDAEEDVLATYKLLVALLVYPLWQLLIAMGSMYWLGIAPGFLASLLLPFAALYAARFIDRRVEALKEVSIFFTTLSQRSLVRALLRERDAIRQEIEALIEAPAQGHSSSSSSSSSSG